MEIDCYFPLGVFDIVRKIGKYFEGDHITNYKLVCKEINEAMKDIKPEPIEITLKNYKRTVMVPGYHFIRIGDDASTLCVTLRYGDLNPVVTHLVVDYCGQASTFITKPQGIISFFKLRSFKIIRCASYVLLDIPEEYCSLSTLEIHSAIYMTITLRRRVKNVRLSSMDLKTDPTLATIEIITDEKLIEYAKKIPYSANSRHVVVRESREIVNRSGIHKDFVPNSRYLIQ